MTTPPHAPRRRPSEPTLQHDDPALTYAEQAEQYEPELACLFSYHPPLPDQVPRYERIRASVHALARELVSSCPRSRELDQAIHYLEVSCMYANASIARREGAAHVHPSPPEQPRSATPYYPTCP